MKKKIFSVGLAVVLVLSLSLMALPVGAAPVALSAIDDEGSGDEDMIEVALPAGFTLGQLESVSWSVYALEGYPPHLDITLGGVPVNESMLTAEMAYNNAEGKELDSTPSLLTYVAYDEWMETFELTGGDGYGAIGDSTMFWVAKMGAGNDDAPSGTLAQWKDGIVGADPDGELAATAISSSTLITKLEIEVDNWVINSVAIVDGIVVMSAGEAVVLGVTILTPEPEPDIVAISVDPTSLNFGTMYPGQSDTKAVTVTNVGTVAVDLSALVTQDTGTIFLDNLTLAGDSWDVWESLGLALEGSLVVPVELSIPLEYVPAGAEGATLVFEVTASP